MRPAPALDPPAGATCLAPSCQPPSAAPLLAARIENTRKSEAARGKIFGRRWARSGSTPKAASMECSYLEWSEKVGPAPLPGRNLSNRGLRGGPGPAPTKKTSHSSRWGALLPNSRHWQLGLGLEESQSPAGALPFPAGHHSSSASSMQLSPVSRPGWWCSKKRWGCGRAGSAGGSGEAAGPACCAPLTGGPDHRGARWACQVVRGSAGDWRAPAHQGEGYRAMRPEGGASILADDFLLRSTGSGEN